MRDVGLVRLRTVPTPADVRAALSDILVAVVACPPESVVDDAVLSDLGVDSLAAVEVADELGRRFGVWLPDDDVDRISTVADAVSCVLALAEAPGDGRVATTLAAPAPPPGRSGVVHRADAFWRLALWFVVAGLVVGGLGGFGIATVVRATGMGNVELPPIVSPTSASPTPSATPTPTTPTPTQTTSGPEATFTVESPQVSPGQRFSISGRLPDVGDDVVLQVQVRDPGGEWDDFPVSVRTMDGGRFETTIYTSRTGEREFRVIDDASGEESPSAKVTIG